MIQKILLISLIFVVVSGCAHKKSYLDVPLDERERHFISLKQLTFSGTNAEAYFSPDSKKLIFQGHDEKAKCDQVYIMNIDGSDKKLLSDSSRNTCSYFIDANQVLFSSTRSEGTTCPVERDRSKGYVWEIFKSYDIYKKNLKDDIVTRLTTENGYDAESTVCGGKVVFSSARSMQSLDIFLMNTDGTGLKQLTTELGYNGGPFFSPDCSKIVYRAFHPKTKADKQKFSTAIHEGYVPSGDLELFVMNADGSNKRKVTSLEAASFAPSFYPNNKDIIFSSSYQLKKNTDSANPHRHVFQLFGLKEKDFSNQKNVEQITYAGTFNGFPMFSPDGKFLVFASNRNSKNPHELQVFLAEWSDVK